MHIQQKAKVETQDATMMVIRLLDRPAGTNGFALPIGLAHSGVIEVTPLESEETISLSTPFCPTHPPACSSVLVFAN